MTGLPVEVPEHHRAGFVGVALDADLRDALPDLLFGVPAIARPATSPFTSAMNTGTPRREKPSAITISEIVLPVPVAPATRP